MRREGPESEAAAQTIGGFDNSGRLWVLGLFGLGGAALGAVFPYLAGLAADLPWLPLQGPIELLASFDERWLVWGRPAVGLILGLGFGGWIVLSSPVLHLSRKEIRVERRGQIQRVIQSEKVDAIYRRGSKVVIETSKGRMLFNDDVEGDKGAIRDAFLRHDYPWEGDTD